MSRIMTATAAAAPVPTTSNHEELENRLGAVDGAAYHLGLAQYNTASQLVIIPNDGNLYAMQFRNTTGGYEWTRIVDIVIDVGGWVADEADLPATGTEGQFWIVGNLLYVYKDGAWVNTTEAIQGEPGVDGRQVEMRGGPTAIQWKYTDEDDGAWRDIIAFDALRGATGERGPAGKVYAETAFTVASTSAGASTFIIDAPLVEVARVINATIGVVINNKDAIVVTLSETAGQTTVFIDTAMMSVDDIGATVYASFYGDLIPMATQGSPGIAQYATTAEAADPTVIDRGLTPAGLHQQLASVEAPIYIDSSFDVWGTVDDSDTFTVDAEVADVAAILTVGTAVRINGKVMTVSAVDEAVEPTRTTVTLAQEDMMATDVGAVVFYAVAGNTIPSATTDKFGAARLGTLAGAQSDTPSQTSVITESILNSVALGIAATQWRIEKWTAAGTYTWTAPEGVTEIWVTMVGGGGGGGGGADPGTSVAAFATGGTGGSAGAGLLRGRVNVAPLETLVLVVGAGGAGNAGGNTVGVAYIGSSGGATSIARDSTYAVYRNGGNPGYGESSSLFRLTESIVWQRASWDGSGEGRVSEATLGGIRDSITSYSFGSCGAASLLGGGGYGGGYRNGANRSGGPGFLGGGGGGGYVRPGTGNLSGGAGGTGVIIIEYNLPVAA